MADFVAVIRRAVDGLSDNNPVMRDKVYEKARGAVRRQLEAMNPRPPEELVQRQLDKLEVAITSVEEEHAEALPAEDPVEESREEDAAVPAALPHEPAPAASHDAPDHVEAVGEDAPAQASDVVEPTGRADVPSDALYHEEAAIEPDHLPDGPAAAETTVSGEAERPTQDADIVAPSEEAPPETVAWSGYASEPAPPVDVPAGAPDVHAEIFGYRDEPVVEEVLPAEPVAVEPEYVPSWQQPEPVYEAPDVAVEGTLQPVAEEEGSALADDAAGDLHDMTTHFEGEVAPADASTVLPGADDPWTWNEPAPVVETTPGHVEANVGSVDPAWTWPDESPEDAVSEPQPAAETPVTTEASAWSDLEELIGYDRQSEDGAKPTTAETAAAGAAALPVEEAARNGQRSFRAEPRPSRFNARTIASLVALLAILGGAAAGYWLNRDAVHDWIAQLTAPAQSVDTASAPVETGTETAEQPAAEAEAPANGEAAQEVASAAANGKFTQRLLPDGTETDEGPAPSLDGLTAEEGKSVAEQSMETAQLATQETVPGTADPAPAATQENAAATQPDESAAVVGAEEPAAVGVAQRMFLYEERLGQTAPTAIEGSVVWSSAEESPGGDARPEPVIRAQINVPARGLTALVTIRRNADGSLPASHIVEIVFSLPPNFEGGSIDSVQRIAMKQTEQDRGDPLIAVPAKITEDFHMIALNDYPEAIARNIDLLRSRNWIDIPMTYRNGRRSLLTLDKGTSGAEAFDTALRAWAALGSAATNSQ